AAAVAWHRAGDDVRAGARQEPGGGFDTAVPEEAEVAATGYGGRAAQSEVWVLPDRGRVHVYLVVTKGNREGAGLAGAPLLLIDNREAEALVEGDERLGVIRGHCYVVEGAEGHDRPRLQGTALYQLFGDLDAV